VGEKDEERTVYGELVEELAAVVLDVYTVCSDQMPRMAW